MKRNILSENGAKPIWIGDNKVNHYCELSKALAVLAGVNTNNDLLDTATSVKLQRMVKTL